VNLIQTINKRLYFYLVKELGYLFLLSLGILTFLLVMSRIGKLADFVINKGVELKDIFLLIFYSSPPYLTFTLPMSFLLTTIVVLGRLSAENEILALKASGINLKYIFYPVASLGIAITLFGMLNTNVLLPKSGELFKQTLINIVKKGIAFDEREGVFNDTIPGVVIYINSVDIKSKELAGIIVSDNRDKNITQMISAQKGMIHLDPISLNLNFILEEGNLHRWEKANNIYRNLMFKDYTFTMNLENMLPSNVPLRKRPYEMNTSELREMASHANESDRFDWLLEIYKRISMPFSSLAFIFLAIPLGIRRKMEGRFSGITYSLFLFVLYYILMAFTEHIGKIIHLLPLITSFLPNIIITIIGLVLMRKLNSEDYIHISQKTKYLWDRYIEKVK